MLVSLPVYERSFEQEPALADTIPNLGLTGSVGSSGRTVDLRSDTGRPDFLIYDADGSPRPRPHNRPLLSPGRHGRDGTLPRRPCFSCRRRLVMSEARLAGGGRWRAPYFPLDTFLRYLAKVIKI